MLGNRLEEIAQLHGFAHTIDVNEDASTLPRCGAAIAAWQACLAWFISVMMGKGRVAPNFRINKHSRQQQPTRVASRSRSHCSSTIHRHESERSWNGKLKVKLHAHGPTQINMLIVSIFNSLRDLMSHCGILSRDYSWIDRIFLFRSLDARNKPL